MFSERLLDHFYRPKWAGDLDSPSATATEGHAPCGDVVQIDIQVADGVVAAARFRTLGCAVAIAASDALCELVAGQSVTAAQFLHLDEVIAALDGIPPKRESCAGAPVAALRSALRHLSPPVR
ncbi:MAG: Fe-S cluster assembly scaffold protein NifU [Actinomycetota bacterium]